MVRLTAIDVGVIKKEGKKTRLQEMQPDQISKHISADAKSAVLLRVPSLIKLEISNFPLLHFPIWLCLVYGQLAMSLQHVKRSLICIL